MSERMKVFDSWVWREHDEILISSTPTGPSTWGYVFPGPGSAMEDVWGRLVVQAAEQAMATS